MAEDAAGVDETLLAELEAALADGAPGRVRARIGALHGADQAEFLRYLPPELRESFVDRLEDVLDPEFLSYVDEEFRADLVRSLGPERTATALANLETDDAIDFLEELDDAQQLQVLAALPLSERQEVEKSLQYAEDSAGRLMQRAFVALPDYWVVGQAIDYLRNHPELPDDFYDIYLVSPRFEPVGSIPLSMVLRSVRSTPLRQLRTKDLHLVHAHDDQEDVARTFRKYGLVSAGDGGGLVVG